MVTSNAQNPVQALLSFAFLEAFYFKRSALLHKHLQLRIARWKYCMFAIMSQPLDKKAVTFCRPGFCRNNICSNLSCNQTGRQGLEVHKGGCFCKICPAAQMRTPCFQSKDIKVQNRVPEYFFNVCISTPRIVVNSYLSSWTCNIKNMCGTVKYN